MILVDANLLLYAYDSTSRFHESSRRWLEEVLSGNQPVGLPWTTLLAFLRISTNPRAMSQPLSLDEASAIVSGWLDQPCVTVPAPGERHWKILVKLLLGAQAKGPLVTDAHLAALALEHGALLATTDRDFTRFDGLRFENPLAPKAPSA